MSIAVPTTHASYPFRAAMLLSQCHEIVCEWHQHTFHADQQPEDRCYLTIALRGQKPHICQEFEDAAACLRYLRENDLPTSGWCPVELVQELHHRAVTVSTVRPFYG